MGLKAIGEPCSCRQLIQPASRLRSRYVGTMYGFVGEKGLNSEDHVKVETRVEVVASKELSILRVCGVGMDLERVEVVRNVGR
jgi:hypothetical protein